MLCNLNPHSFAFSRYCGKCIFSRVQSSGYHAVVLSESFNFDIGGKKEN
jgi:hypothetical protein